MQIKLITPQKALNSVYRKQIVLRAKIEAFAVRTGPLTKACFAIFVRVLSWILMTQTKKVPRYKP